MTWLPEIASGATPIVFGDDDPVAVGVLQDLLHGHNHTNMPGLHAPGRGNFGPQTKQALLDFAAEHNLTIDQDWPQVDSTILQRLVQEPADTPRLSPAYVTLGLKVAWSPWHDRMQQRPSFSA